MLGSSRTGIKTEKEPPGTIVTADKNNGLTVACGDGKLLSLKILQPGGKRIMDSLSFINGYPVRPGTVLGKE